MRVSCVSIRCTSSLRHIRWSAIYPLAYHLGMSLVPPPVTLLNKSVGTRSGVAPGAPVGVLASWDVGAPRAECAVYSEKRGTSSQFRSESQSDWHIFANRPIQHRKLDSASQHFRFGTFVSQASTERPMSAEAHHAHTICAGLVPGTTQQAALRARPEPCHS